MTSSSRSWRQKPASTICYSVFDLPKLETEVAALEKASSVPSFWDDPPNAQRQMQMFSRLQEAIHLWRGLEFQVNGLLELADLAIEAEDEEMAAEIQAESVQVSQKLDREEVQLTLSGPYDDRSAIISIYSGAGGTESQDWAEMLLRMYLRWCETHGRKVDVLDISHGDEVGIRSATMEVSGGYATGYLRGENGVHRLVRISPFDGDHARHTSFARVEVIPAADNDPDIVIRPQDLKADFFRSSGPGGQNVQKVSSAVRLTHLPTGIVVACQNERSQHQNREFAMRILMAKLLERQNTERAEEMARLRGEHLSAEWGNQIRSYVLQPYRMVKDHRTGHETSNTDAVLDGEIDGFLQAYLLSQVGV